MNPIFPIALYSQGLSASIPSQRRMHGCVVLASSAPSLPCKRAGRRASSGISFSDAVQQAQLSYPKSAQLCRLLEAFEGFRCRSSPQPQTLRDGRHYSEDVDSLIVVISFATNLQGISRYSISQIAQHNLAKVRSSPLAAPHTQSVLYPTHTLPRPNGCEPQPSGVSPVLGTWAMSRTTSNGLLA